MEKMNVLYTNESINETIEGRIMIVVWEWEWKQVQNKKAAVKKLGFLKLKLHRELFI
jgi:hypothetical protein